MTTKTKAIRALNDELRQNFATGTAVMTAGVAALGAEAVVVENADHLFKLRWRDNASIPPITRPRFDLALICPDAA